MFFQRGADYCRQQLAEKNATGLVQETFEEESERETDDDNHQIVYDAEDEPNYMYNSFDELTTPSVTDNEWDSGSEALSLLNLTRDEID